MPQDVTNESLRIETPEDGFVQFQVGNGPVVGGQQIAVIRSPKLEQMAASIYSYQMQIEIAERPFNDGRVGDEIAALKQKETLLKSAVDENTKLVADITTGVQIGRLTEFDLSQQMVKLYSAQSAYADGYIAAEHADRKAKDMQDKIEACKAALSDRAKFIQEMQAALTISSPYAGTLVQLAAWGTFARKGHIIAQVTL